MDVKQTFTDGLDFFSDVLRAVPANAWDNTTPCTDWTARQLTGHLVTVLELASANIRGDNPGSSIAPTELGPDPVTDWTRSAARARAEVEQADMDAVRPSAVGTTPLRELLGFCTVDLYVHAWDLGRSFGREVRLPEQVAGWIDGFLRRLPAEGMRTPHTFAAEQPAPTSADATTKLMAFLGREV